MQNIRQFAQRYVDWVIKLGRLKFSLLGFSILGIFALGTQIIFNHLFVGQTYWQELIRSIAFGLISAPFFIYFFNLLVEKLELSRQKLAHSNKELNLNMQKLNEAKTQIEHQAVFLRSFIDASPDVVFYRSEKGYTLGCNRAFEQLTGKTEKELRSLSLQNIFPPEIAKRMSDTDKQILQTNESATYEYWLKYPDGKSACFEISKVPYFDHINNQHNIMGFGRDITERKRYQEVIEKTSRDKTTLMATISHELRTPLNGIVGLSRILLDSKLTDEQRNYLQTINVSAVSLGHIFSDIIDLEKMDTRRIEIMPKETDFTAWLNDMSNFATLMAAQKKLKFSIRYGENLPHWAKFDAVRLNQILWNLVNNAVKFTEKGEIILKIDRTSVGELQFSLTDTGIGIPQEEQVKVFAMYYQVQSGKKLSKSIGSGIGLSISKRLAKLMGGDLTVSSEVGKGSTFTLQIKAEEVSKPNVLTAKVDLTLHILLVEDIEINIIVAKSVLEKLGYKVDVAVNGQQAIEKFEQNQYDLVFLDIQLPDMTGFEIARHLRKNYEDGVYDYLPPLIALTANVMQSKAEYQRQGMDDVLRKPLSVEALSHCLMSFFADESAISSVHAETALNQKSAVKNTEISADCFDIPTLQEFKEMLGVPFLLNNLALFKQTMPDYMRDLTRSYRHYRQNKGDKKTVAEHAHKIKGAAAAVGLKRLQQIAQSAQVEDAADWENNIQSWISDLKDHWLSDVKTLEKWLKRQK